MTIRPRFRRLALISAAAALSASLAGCGGTAAADSAGDVGGTTSASATLSLRGLTVAVPDGWGSESFVNASGMSVIRVGSFTFPDRPDDDVGQVARESMKPDDVLINIVDFTGVDERDSTYRPVESPLTVDGSEATGQEGYYVPAIIDSVLIEGHKLYLSVAFGKAPPSAAQVSAANAVLSTLSGS